ncbi:beta-N-acetylhexosaminidase [Methylotuvimicrobium alcaliphilum]|uniref:Beta-hexosaminidase n=1 Tax=Methylotuvimicrobium alcaliphilum (strain DSM 19304 / NCIMB 14124 / VKM B-2133 / 20Z) TaxID=1091494 RepID=G4SVU5_META2|nr:beta-N-acetylhexosaminidase [Methylotuvimicrobium alcaliphilum]CCE25180.1 Beta-hexosaminidase [Methylotuvimicrobium alcaliphilum 20Z]
MTTNSAIGPIMIDVEGLTLTTHEQEKIHHPNTGAVILFSRNYESPEQLIALIDSIRNARKGPILIAVDQEGGRVQRFKQGFTRLPPANCYRERPELAEAAGWLMASEMLSVGIDFSFAPVLDVDCGISEVIGDRSFSTDPQLTAQLAASFRKGMRSAGMSATGKHFPGHGAVAADSHIALPVDERELSEIRTKDLVPFKLLIEQGLEAVMPAHVVYPAVDDMPAGFSQKWLQNILRRELYFNGAIFSDDLNMEGAAIAGDFSERAKLAQQAGCDMLLVCNNPKAAEQVLDSVPIKTDPLRTQRLDAMRGIPKMTRAMLQASNQWQQISQQIAQISNEYA